MLTGSTVNGLKRKIRNPFLTGESIEDWSSELVIQSIRGLHRTDPKLTLASMRTNRRAIDDPVLSALIGKPSSRKFLHYVACQNFGSWKAAMIASSLRPRKTSFNKFWSKTKITRSIRTLREKGYPLTVKSIWRDRSRRTRKILLECTGTFTTGSSLHDAARRYFGSWDAALRSAGIDPETIKEKPFWTKKKIIQSLRSLHSSGVALNYGTMDRDYSVKTKRIIKAELGKDRVGRSLFGGASRSFGSWDRALHEAGINPSTIRRRDFNLTKPSVGRVLRILHDSNIPINASSLAKDESQETCSIIYDCTGQVTPGSFLFQLGHKKWGSWDSAIKYSGLWLSEVRRRGTPCARDHKFIIKVIRLFSKNDIAMNTCAVITRSNQIKFLMEQTFGSVISGMSVMGAAKEVFGSWDKALWEAGLDPGAIRLRSRSNTSNLSLMSTQKERIKIDGDLRNVTYFGAPPKSPEDLLEESETKDQLESAVSRCNRDDQEAIDRIFDAILQIHHYRDREQLVEFIVDHLNGEIPAPKVKSILETLAGQL